MNLLVLILLHCFLGNGMGNGGLRVVREVQTLPAGESPTPVLVELFTSEGCSSCPPADRFLEHLDEAQPLPGVQVVAMSEHVDYWNHDGWVDPFSSPDFTLRQQTYNQRLRVTESYTPQMVVDGTRQCVGSDRAEAEGLIRAAGGQAKLAVRIAAGRRKGTVAVEVDGPAASARRGDVYAALAENDALSDVLAGENRGLKLHHVAIVRKIRKLGTLDKQSTFHGELSVARFAGGRVIAFVEEPATGAVIGAAMYKVPR